MSNLSKIIFLLDKKKIYLPIMILMFLFLSIIDLIGIGLIGPYVSLIFMPDKIQDSEYYDLVTKMGLPADSNDLIVIVVFFWCLYLC